MGVQQKSYLGPYITAKNELVWVDAPFYGCTDQTCSGFSSRSRSSLSLGKFCSSCGKPTGQTSLKESRYKTLYDVVGDRGFDDFIPVESDRGRLLLVPNRTRIPTRADNLVWLEPDPSIDVDFQTPWTMEPDIRWMMQEFETTIKKIREGFTDIKMKWGFVLFFQ